MKGGVFHCHASVHLKVHCHACPLAAVLFQSSEVTVYTLQGEIVRWHGMEGVEDDGVGDILLAVYLFIFSIIR